MTSKLSTSGSTACVSKRSKTDAFEESFAGEM